MRYVCIFCGRESDVIRVELPKTFTAYQYLQAGHGACKQCASMLKDERIRRSSWIWDRDGIKLISDPLSALLNPPDPPFRIYITKAKRKHGWIRVVNKVNHSRERFWVGFEEELLLTNRIQLKDMIDFARALREKGVLKAELTRGELRVKSFEKVGWESQQKLKEFAGNLVWNMVVSLIE